MRRVKHLIGYQCEDTASGNYLGQGIGIVVLDTGISPHPDFGERIRKFHDFVNQEQKMYDDSGHGTHVAGILAGDGRASRGYYKGMAPKAELFIGKVLDKKGNGTVWNVIQGIEWILSNYQEYGIRIVNISVGTNPELDKMQKRQLILGVERLWDAGLVVVASAGNYGPKKGSVAVPGVSKKVITVGVYDGEWMNHRYQEGLWKYSGIGPTDACVIKPDVMAPGRRIISCNRMRENRKMGWYTTKSGTSMAAPVVAGAIACLLSKYPDMSNVEVKLRLWETCRRLKEEGTGWGMLNVERLLK